MDPTTTQGVSTVGVEDFVGPLPAVDAGQMQGVAWVFVFAVALSFGARRVGRFATAQRFRRWLPVIYAGIWGLSIAGVTAIYARGLSSTWLLLVWLLFLMVVFASVGWLRSVMSGVALVLEQRILMGDSVRINGIEGEVVGFGLRSVTLRSVDGTIHEVPNEKFVTESVANLTGGGGDSACELTVRVPNTIHPQRALVLARSAATVSPLASPRHRPEIFLDAVDDAQDLFEVRIRGYAFDAAYQDHFRSDVLSRLHEGFGALSAEPKALAGGD